MRPGVDRLTTGLMRDFIDASTPMSPVAPTLEGLDIDDMIMSSTKTFGYEEQVKTAFTADCTAYLSFSVWTANISIAVSEGQHKNGYRLSMCTRTPDNIDFTLKEFLVEPIITSALVVLFYFVTTGLCLYKANSDRINVSGTSFKLMRLVHFDVALLLAQLTLNVLSGATYIILIIQLSLSSILSCRMSLRLREHDHSESGDGTDGTRVETLRFDREEGPVPHSTIPKIRNHPKGALVAMLDSSPVALPPVPRPLKRSASVASLPTPPRTHHKRKHASRSARSDDSDIDTDRGQSSASEEEEEEEEKGHKCKKQRTSTSKNVDADEEAFWLNKSDGDASVVAPSKKLPSGLVYRRRLAAAAASTSSVGSAPVSPPPSNRKPVVATVAPVTPEPPRRSKRGPPMRDSPNNPFLVSPASIAEDSASPTPSLSPHTPQHFERPTVTYVFRGVRGTFPNPLYDHERGRPRSPSARSQLPIEHPDFSPDPHCAPKLLFPAAPRKPQRPQRKGPGLKTLDEELRGRKRGRSVSVSRSESGSDVDDGEEEAGEERRVKLKKLDFAVQLAQAGSSQEQ
ncbi:hypothetical protein DXG01_016099 [Tephrocybe rancida]|nr:hypothetical protein DXG01_016099 [Tephrocybe rancida]